MINESITNDLRSGLSLDETLKKHNTNLKELFKNEKVRKHRGSRKTSAASYIYPTSDGKYLLRKTTKKKLRFYGLYNSRKDAETIRELLKENGWKQRSVDRLCKENGISRCIGRNEYRYKGA